MAASGRSSLDSTPRSYDVERRYGWSAAPPPEARRHLDSPAVGRRDWERNLAPWHVSLVAHTTANHPGVRAAVVSSRGCFQRTDVPGCAGSGARRGWAAGVYVGSSQALTVGGLAYRHVSTITKEQFETEYIARCGRPASSLYSFKPMQLFAASVQVAMASCAARLPFLNCNTQPREQHQASALG